jgi:hypothetical protein
MINRVLAPYLGKFCMVYLDDVSIYNKTSDEHLEHILLVFRELLLSESIGGAMAAIPPSTALAATAGMDCC